MRPAKLFVGIALAAAVLSGCTSSGLDLPQTASVSPTPRPETEAKADGLNGMIDAYAAAYDVPRALVHRVVKRESNYNPIAYSSGNWGLMQIRHGTAKNMGYDGSAKGLLDAETNLKYAVKYLRGAYLVAGGNHDQAVRLYARGYYYDAKRKGMLEETGLRGDEVQVASVAATDAGEVQAAETTAERGEAVAAAPAEDAASARVAAAAEGSEPPAAEPGPGSALAAAPAGDAEPVAAMSFAGATPTIPAFAPVPTPSPR